jgi:hypothetical protein
VAQVLLVHGIAQEQLTPDSLEASWLPALAGGVRLAGHPDLADRLWRNARPGDIETRMAFYGDLFRAPGAQSGHPQQVGWTLDQHSLAEQLALVLLQAAADRGSHRDKAAALQGLREICGDTTGAQGSRATLRPAITALTRVPWFAPLGVAIAGRAVMHILDQVTRYLTDDAIRASAKATVTSLIAPDTKVVIGHSLGSVVAYEALFETVHRVAFITLGSPLGLREVVYERLRPTPPVTPESVKTWTNIADVDDLVAAELELRFLFPPATGQLPVPMVDLRADNGAKPHASEYYLGKKSVGSALASALA